MKPSLGTNVGKKTGVLGDPIIIYYIMATMENFTIKGKLHFEKYNLQNYYKELGEMLNEVNAKLREIKGENYHIQLDAYCANSSLCIKVCEGVDYLYYDTLYIHAKNDIKRVFAELVLYGKSDHRRGDCITEQS